MCKITDEAWLVSESPCEVAGASGDEPIRKIWFKKRVEKDFCFRVTQLQLCTDSYDRSGIAQDDGVTETRRDWTWFEIAILADETATEPKVSKEGKALVWPSHSNRRANSTSQTRHFGAIFDRRCDLLVNLEVGDVIAIMVCARYPDSINFADKGYLLARVLDEDLFTPHRWTLGSDAVPALGEQVEDGSYSFMAPTTCLVKAEGNDLASQMWFTTPALDDETIRKLESVQLFTYSRFQDAQKEPVPDGDRFSWFDLVILETPFCTAPRVENGVSLVWKSHANKANTLPDYPYHGQRYDIEDEANQAMKQLAIAMKGALKPGNAIGVRVNAQYPGWENYARVGQMIVRVSNEVAAPIPTLIPDVAVAAESQVKIRQGLVGLIANSGFASATSAVLSNETRADDILSTRGGTARKLRLLSLDGGGVRGVSPLRVLKKIMAKVAELEGRPGIKPCEYFDMIVGTSTGGLIALMLGRLEMTIEECETCYDEISKAVFENKRWIQWKGVAHVFHTDLYDPQPLIDAVKSVVFRELRNPEALMMDPTDPNPRCKVMVMSALASTVEDGNTAIHLRSYKTTREVPSESSGWKIWEAARATSAAPVYFPRFEKDGLEFVDGGLGFNNPGSQLLCELVALYGWNINLQCLLSLGTGTPPEMHLGEGLGSVEQYAAIATNSEITHGQVLGSALLLPALGDPDKYWRFNMNKAMSGQDWVEKLKADFDWRHPIATWPGGGSERLRYEQVMVEMDDWTALRYIRALTDKWLDHGVDEKAKARISDQIHKCAARIANGN